jgi:hypothetical protein
MAVNRTVTRIGALMTPVQAQLRQVLENALVITLAMSKLIFSFLKKSTKASRNVPTRSNLLL